MADSKISELTALTTPASDDVLAIVDTSAGVTKKIAISNLATSSEVVDDTTPQLGGDLDLNSNDITGTGNIDVTGTVTADGLSLGDNEFLLAGGTDLKIGSDGTTSILRSQGVPLVIDANGITFRGYSPYTTHMDIATNGDISFYEDTGTTAKFFWDASAESLGIGTSSPASGLHVLLGSADVFRLERDSTNDWRFQLTAGALAFRDATNDAERLRIDSDGNVGIGTTSPSNKLHVHGGDASVYSIFAKSDTKWMYLHSGATDPAIGWDTGGSIRFGTATSNVGAGFSEKMRIDSSGNLLVGKTSAGLGTTGVEASSGGYIRATRDGNSLTLNRISTDGNLATFTKDGTTVGSIGVIHGNNLFIGAPSHSGLQFGTTIIYPTGGSTGDANDATVDIGASGQRFKDLYLSGTATMDGLTVDDITINGSTISDAGNFTIDAGGDIALDAGGSDIQFLASGTEFGRVFGSSDNFYIQARQSDKDMIFQGIDGGSAITALTLDMSDAGKATFNHDVFVGGNLNVIGVDVNITANVNHSGDGDTFFGFHGDDLWRVATGGVERLEVSNSGIIINDSGVDADFRIESQNNAQALFVQGSSGNVGIGTSSPSTKLDINGGIKFVDTMIFSDSGATVSCFFQASTNIFQYGTSTSDPIVIYTNNAERMRIDSSGKVLIGLNSGSQQLAVKNPATSGTVVAYYAELAYSPDDNTSILYQGGDTTTNRFFVYSDGDVQNHDNSYGAISDERIKQDIRDSNSQWNDIKAVKVRNFKKKDDVRQYGDNAWEQIGVVAQELEAVSPKLIRRNDPSASDIISSSEFGTLYTADDSETQDAVLYTADDQEVIDGDKNVGDIKTPSTKQIGEVKTITEQVKSVSYSVLYMKAIKALQEAMDRIETLEAKVTTLENN